MPATLSFINAEQSDIPFLLNLRKSSMTSHLLEAGIVGDDAYHLARINEFFHDSLIIQYNQKPIGLLKLSKIDQRIHIRQLQIIPDMQGRGIGTKVLSAVKKRANKLALPVTLNVLLSNPAKALYERSGFKVIGQTNLEYQMRYSGG